MKLLLKFNLVFLLVFVLGLAASGTIARKLLQDGAHEEVLDRARLLMENAMAVSSYTANQVAPLLETQMKYTFLPQSVPAYSSTEVLNALRKAHPEYAYKAAMLNPTNPRDRAQDWEEDVIMQFKQDPERTEFIGQRDTPAGRSLYIARPIKITNANCLRCHSTVDAAPAPLVEKYGPANGFGWVLNEPLGAQVVSVPMSVPLQRARPRLHRRDGPAGRRVRRHRRRAQPDAVAAGDPAGEPAVEARRPREPGRTRRPRVQGTLA